MNAQGPWHCRYLNRSNDPENWYYVRPPLELPLPPYPQANPKGREDPHPIGQGLLQIFSLWPWSLLGESKAGNLTHVLCGLWCHLFPDTAYATCSMGNM